MIDLSWTAFFERLFVAIALGSLIGLEREWRQRSAGLHTASLVAVGAAMYTMIAPLLGMAGDATRISAQVVTGIGFLAGGVILKDGATIRGLKTAATVWATAAIGVTVGFGFYVQGTVGALVIVGVNLLYEPLVDYIGAHVRPRIEAITKYDLQIDCTSVPVRDAVRAGLISFCRNSIVNVSSVRSKPDGDVIRVSAVLTKAGYDELVIAPLLTQLKAIEGTSAHHWEITESAH